MGIFDAPELTEAIDTQAGGTVRLSLVPGHTSDIQVWYRTRGAVAWIDGGLFPGVEDVSMTYDVTGLVDGEMYEFILQCIHGSNTGYPSVSHRASPTDGSGSVEEQAIAAIVIALQGITVANGYLFDIGRVYRHETVPEKCGLDAVTAFLDEEPDIAKLDGARGSHHLTRNIKPIVVSMVSRRKGRSHGAGNAESSKEAKRLYDAVGKAIGGDLVLDNGGGRKVLYIRYLGHRSGIGTEGANQVIVHTRFEVHYRHRSDNPSLKG